MMRDYAETVQAMRYAFEQPCYDCVLGEKCNWGDFCFFKRAADAIEELLAAVRSVVRCKECEWWTKQEASIQGRCARLAMYPTGEFYCASGSKAEPPKGVE